MRSRCGLCALVRSLVLTHAPASVLFFNPCFLCHITSLGSVDVLDCGECLGILAVPGADVLAAAGYDEAVVLYGASGEYPVLQKISYQPLGGPAFIWSLEWSADASHLVVGCWNAHAYVYSYEVRFSHSTARRLCSSHTGFTWG